MVVPSFKLCKNNWRFLKFVTVLYYKQQKTGWIGGNTDFLVPIFYAEGLGFALVLYAKLKLDIQFA